MGCRLEVRVTPRASRDRIEAEEGKVRVWTTAAPTDGQANEAVRKALAKRLGVAPSRVSIVRGEASREKVVEVEEMTQEEAWAMLGA